MTIPKTGRVTLAQIQGEFRPGSNSAPHCISEYYRDGVNVPDIVENNGVPTRGTICFSDFYGSSDQVRPSSITLPPIDVDDFWQETAEVNNWTDIQDNWRQHVTRINDRHAVAVDIRSPAALVDVWSGNATRGVEVNLKTEVGASSDFEKLLRNTQENKDYFEFGEWSLTIPAKFTRFRIVATAGGGSGSVQKTELSGDFLLDTTLPATEESGYKGGDARIISENGTVELYGAPGGQDPAGVPDTQIVPEQGQHTVRNNGTVTGDFVKITPAEVDYNVQFYWNNAVRGSFFSNRHAGSSKHELETTNWQYETQSQISTENGIRYYAVLRTPIIADVAYPQFINDPNWTILRSDIMKVVGGEKTEKGEGKRLAEFPDEAVYAAQLVVNAAGTVRGEEALSDFGVGKHPINMFFRWGLAQGRVHSADGSIGRGGHSLYGSGTEAAAEYPNLSGPSGTPAFGAGGGPGQHGGRGSNSLGWTNTYGGYGAATAYLGDFETAPGEIITIKVPQGGEASRNEYTDVYNNEGERFVSKSDRGGDGIVQIYGQHGPAFSMMSHAGIVLMDDTGRVLKSLVTNGVSDKGTNTDLPNRTNKLSVLLPGSDDPENPRRYYIGYTARIKKNGRFQTKMGFKSPGATINITPNYIDTANELPVQSLYREADWHSADEIAVGTKGVRDGPDLEDVPNWFIRKCNVKFDIATTGSTEHQLIFKKVASSDAEVGPAQISISNGSVTAEVGYDEVYKLVTSGIGISPNKTVTIKTRSKDGKLQVGHDNFSSIKLSAAAFSSSNPSERHGNFYVQGGITYWSCSKETSSGTTEGTSASFAVAVPDPEPVLVSNNNDDDDGGSSGGLYSHYEPSTGTTTYFDTAMTHEQVQDLRAQQPGGVFSSVDDDGWGGGWSNSGGSVGNIDDNINDNGEGDVSSQNTGCVIATHAVANGSFKWSDKQNAMEWCKKTLHDKWWGETMRRGYRHLGRKHITNGTAETVYKEFKECIEWANGKRPFNIKIASRYYYRAAQTFFVGLFIKEDI